MISGFPYGVKNFLKMLMYWRVHSAFSEIFALSGNPEIISQQLANR